MMTKINFCWNNIWQLLSIHNYTAHTWKVLTVPGLLASAHASGMRSEVESTFWCWIFMFCSLNDSELQFHCFDVLCNALTVFVNLLLHNFDQFNWSRKCCRLLNNKINLWHRSKFATQLLRLIVQSTSSFFFRSVCMTSDYHIYEMEYPQFVLKY